MIELTVQQRDELRRMNGRIIDVTDPATREEYVLIRKQVYERLREMIADVNQRADWDDPAFDVYDKDPS